MVVVGRSCVGSRTDLPYLGIAMMKEFNELEALI